MTWRSRTAWLRWVSADWILTATFPPSQSRSGCSNINWTWLHVSLLWVAEERRHSGLGSRLLCDLEAAAAERGCRHAHLDTFSYQARPFYERHGYTLFATLDDYPPGHQRFFLRKTFASASASSTELLV